MLFWVPTLLRLALILLAAVVPGYFLGKTVGLLAALIAVCLPTDRCCCAELTALQK